MQEAVNAPNIVAKDGWLYDADTGEQIGLVEVEERWEPKTQEEVEWVLEKMQEADAERIKQEGLLAAKQTHFGKLIKTQKSRLEFLEAKYKLPIEQFAKKALEGKKSKTLPTEYGDMKFVKQAEKIVVADEIKAVEWAEKELPEAVRVNVEKSIVMAALKGRDLPDGPFQTVPSWDKFSIDTLLEPKKKKTQEAET